MSAAASRRSTSPRRAGRSSASRASPRRSSVSCTDHNGHDAAYMQQWDGTKWVKVSDWIQPDEGQGASDARRGGQGLRRRRTPAGRSAPKLATSRRKPTCIAIASPRRRGRRRFLVGSGCGSMCRRRARDIRRRAQAETHPLGQQHRGDLRSRHPGAEGRVARRAEGRHRGAARRQRRRQDHHAEGDLQPAARRARRRHQGLDRVRRRRGAGPARPTSWCGAAASR